MSDIGLEMQGGIKRKNLFFTVLNSLASLKITVTIFALGMFLIFIGTLAQASENLWTVIEKYFRSFGVSVPFWALVPPDWFPKLHDDLYSKGYGFFFFGGKTLGIALMINLVSAHIVRFKANGSSRSTIIGSIAVLFGLVLTVLMVLGASYADGVQDDPIVSYQVLWRTMLSATIAIGVSLIGTAFMVSAKKQLERIMLIVGAVLALVMSGGLFVLESMSDQLESAMRIVWQLSQATIVGCVLLLGCSYIFRNRGGIVLLHFGIAMMMMNELFVGMFAVEERITVSEGSSTRYAYNINETELAVTTRKNDKDQVVSIPAHLLKPGELISHDDLPFDVRVDVYISNSKIRSKKNANILPEMRKPSSSEIEVDGKTFTVKPTVGRGLFAYAIQVPFSESEANLASAYVSLLDKESGESISQLLLAQAFNETGMIGRDDGSNAEKVNWEGKTIELSLRYRRVVKPYLVELNDVVAEFFHGSNTPKNYQSDFRVSVDDGESIQTTITMNNPLRFRGETFYQASYGVSTDGTRNRDGSPKRVENTTLQVVTNRGWTIPYIGCMYVVIGMIAQFGSGLLKFFERIQKRRAERRAEKENEKATGITATPKPLRPVPMSVDDSPSPAKWLIPLCIGILGLYTTYKMTVGTKTGVDEFNIRSAGKIPVSNRGRFQPLDSYARVLLRRFSDYESVSLTKEQRDADFKDGRKRVYATEWLMDVIAQPDVADKEYRIFRIYDPFLISKLKLEKKRKGYTYTYGEVSAEYGDFVLYVREAHRIREKKSVRDLKVQQRKALKLYDQIREYESLRNATLVLDLDEGDNPIAAANAAAKQVITQRVLTFRPVELNPLKTDGTIEDFANSVILRLIDEDRANRKINFVDYVNRFAEPNGSLIKVQTNSPLFVPTRLRIDLETPDKETRLNLPLKVDPSELKEGMEQENTVVKGSIIQQKDDLSIWELMETDREKYDSPSTELDWQRRPGMEVQTLATVRKVLRALIAAHKFQNSQQLVSQLMRKDPVISRFIQDPRQFFEKEVDERIDAMIRENRETVLTLLQQKQRLSGDTDVRKLAEEFGELVAQMNRVYRSIKREELQDLEKSYRDLVNNLVGSQLDSAVQSDTQFDKILFAYKNNDIKTFNDSIESYLKYFKEKVKLAEFNFGKVQLEHFYRYSNPMYQALILYGISGFFILLAWVFYATDLNAIGLGIQRSAVLILALGSLIHTIGIVERIMITGKPPVTNLYASAVFISWGSVICGLIIELIIRFAVPRASKLGFGTLLGALMGFVVILISFYLSLRNDTFGKIQAVLDTQFWLATHVVCVTFGYVATFVAGVLGLIYLVGTSLTPSFDKEIRRAFSWIIYGIVCFALLLSFFGTVLGGLWGDDSWGRFWGWDPKENGALLIVIWNALILHARWGGMVREKGLAVLALAGNVVTSWSWFGVNELGVGLHSYGFTEGVLYNLGLVAGFHLLVIVAAVTIPSEYWLSIQAEKQAAEKAHEAEKPVGVRPKKKGKKGSKK